MNSATNTTNDQGKATPPHVAPGTTPARSRNGRVRQQRKKFQRETEVGADGAPPARRSRVMGQAKARAERRARAWARRARSRRRSGHWSATRRLSARANRRTWPQRQVRPMSRCWRRSLTASGGRTQLEKTIGEGQAFVCPKMHGGDMCKLIRAKEDILSHERAQWR